jgi:hypothetical protein
VEYVGRGRVEDLASLAMLRAQLGWETLVEDSFVRSMCGARSASGFSPALLQPPHRSIASTAVLRGRQYVSWSVQSTLNRAQQAFGLGEPFASSLGAARMVLDDMSAVRNRIAHPSAYAASEFAQVVRARIGYVPRGMTPGRFLLTPLGDPRVSGGLRFIELYLNTLLGAAAILIP